MIECGACLILNVALLIVFYVLGGLGYSFLAPYVTIMILAASVVGAFFIAFCVIALIKNLKKTRDKINERRRRASKSKSKPRGRSKKNLQSTAEKAEATE